VLKIYQLGMFHPSSGAVGMPVAVLPPVVFHFRGCFGLYPRGYNSNSLETKPLASLTPRILTRLAERHVKDFVSQQISSTIIAAVL